MIRQERGGKMGMSGERIKKEWRKRGALLYEIS
jgi:hypothetical protein